MQEMMPLGSPFPTLGARVIHAYLAAYPDYAPAPGETDPESQQQLHGFFREVISACCQNPKLIGIEDEPDRCFAERWILNNKDPELTDAMARIEKKFFDWVAILHKVGMQGEAKGDSLLIAKQAWRVPSQTIKKLESVGLACESMPDGLHLRCPSHPDVFPAWKRRAALHTGKNGQLELLTRFLLGTIPDHPFSATQMFGKLYPDAAWLEELEAFFIRLGYTCKNDERHLMVAWEKVYPGKERGYLHISYRFRDRWQMCFEFRVPAFRLLLQNCYDHMEYALGELCFMRTKECDNCGYCTQTDKSGKRKKLAQPLKYPGGIKLKCPLWPWFTWGELDMETITKMEKLFLLAEDMLLGQKAKQV